MANPNPPRLPIDPETGRFLAMLAADEYLPETVEKCAKAIDTYAKNRNLSMTDICRSLHLSEGTLYLLLTGDNPAYNPIKASYQRARKARAIAGADQCVSIIDDDSRDIHNDKPNSAAVLRDKHRVDTRLRLAAAHDPATYGTAGVQVNVEINLGDRLSNALQRVGEVIEIVDNPVDKS